MLIKDFEALSRKEHLNWALVGDEDDEDAELMREFHSHFMPKEKASQLVKTFAKNNQ